MFRVIKKSDMETIYEMEDASIFATKVKTKRLQRETSRRTEVIGQSEVTLLGVIPIAKIAQTKEVEDTVETAKYYLEETPGMVNVLNQIASKLKGKEVMRPGRLHGSLKPEQEAGEFTVVPYICEMKDRFILAWSLV